MFSLEPTRRANPSDATERWSGGCGTTHLLILRPYGRAVSEHIATSPNPLRTSLQTLRGTQDSSEVLFKGSA